MADMAQLDDVQDAWDAIMAACNGGGGDGVTLVPITYINSSAAIKSFVGQHGGAVCTSSNCEKILRWALSKGGAGAGLEETGASGLGKVNKGDAFGASVSSGPDSARSGGGAPGGVKVMFFPDQHLGR